MRNQSVYVIESESGLVKIGIAQNPRARSAAISTQSGFKLKRTFFTNKCSNAGDVEHAAHMFFKDKRVHGEWFEIEFEEAVQKVKRLFEAKAKPEKEDNNFGLCLLFYSMHYLRAAQLVGQSSKELVTRICANEGYRIVEIGKPVKTDAEIDLELLSMGVQLIGN